jgi:hypothetical protein
MKLRKKTPNIRITYMDETDKRIKFFFRIRKFKEPLTTPITKRSKTKTSFFDIEINEQIISE